MDKVLLIVPDNNKGKYITKGYGSAFENLSYFVIEKKIFDLNIQEIDKISPHIIFLYWTGLLGKDKVLELTNEYKYDKTVFIHCAEYLKDIPDEYKKLKNHYIFTNDEKKKKYKIKPAVSLKDYKIKFNGYKYNISFCGNPAYKKREEILSKLILNFGPINIFCRSYDFYKSIDEIYELKLLDDYFMELYKQSYKGYVETQKELAFIYSASQINIDMEAENKKDINYRCLEILASGGFLISEYNDNLVKNFDDGKDLETYTNSDDLIDKINFYQKNLNLAQLIAARGRKNAASNFSYNDRLKQILKVIYGKDISSR